MYVYIFSLLLQTIPLTEFLSNVSLKTRIKTAYKTVSVAEYIHIIRLFPISYHFTLFRYFLSLFLCLIYLFLLLLALFRLYTRSLLQLEKSLRHSIRSYNFLLLKISFFKYQVVSFLPLFRRHDVVLVWEIKSKMV